jgi:hypothetical protein
MTDFSTGRLDPASRLSLEHPQEQRDPGPGRRRNPKPPQPKQADGEEPPDEPQHELDQMA